MKTNPLIAPGSSLLIVGFGISGEAAARYAVQCGATVYVSDSRDIEALAETERLSLQQYCRDWECGRNSLQFLDCADMLFVSPGVPDELELIQAAEKRGIPVVGELALVAPVMESLVVAVTGTNGKTTVTSLIGALFQQEFKDVFVGGNIGTPLLESLLEGRQPDVVVLELSSFQLDHIGAFRPDIAVLLNVTPDHIDRHKTFARYRDAKAKIFVNQRPEDTAILCAEDIQCVGIGASLSLPQVLSFGYRSENAAYITEKTIVLCHELQNESYTVPTSLDSMVGKLNCAAAILAARYGGCSPKNIEAGLKIFRTLPHRLEPVASIDDVFYYDDSKATNTGAVIGALRQIQGKIVLIAGGRDKGEDYGLLRDVVGKKVKHLLLIGESAAALAASLDDLVPVSFAASMDDAVRQSQKLASAGDTVLLSPACSSFDMFSGYAERGDKFKTAVLALQNR